MMAKGNSRRFGQYFAVFSLALVLVAIYGAVPSTASFSDKILPGAANFQAQGASTSDAAGRAIAPVGDINEDGRGDILVGAPLADRNARTDSGSAYVVFGRDPGIVDFGALGSGGIRFDGATPGERAGASVAGVGDVNGDSIPDLLVGAPGATPGGVVYVIFGGPTLPSTLDLASLGANGFRVEGIAGEALAEPALVDANGQPLGGLGAQTLPLGGDVNGDNLDDLVLGARFADKSGRVDSGAAYVVFGKSSTTPIQLASLSSSGFEIRGGAPGDRAGTAVARLRDVNGDGRAEVAVGAPGADPSSRGDAGSIFVVSGMAVPTTVDLALATGAGLAPPASGYRIDGAQSGHAVGQALASAGDADGDGGDDLIVGTPHQTVTGGYVVFGKGTSTTSIDLGTLGADGYRIDGTGVGISAGFSVAGVYDLNDDGRSEVLLGDPDADVGTFQDAGRVFVVFGKDDGATVPLSSLSQAGKGYRIDGANSGDRAGFAVAGLDDFNGDRASDLTLGAPGADPAGRTDAGLVYGLHGWSPAQDLPPAPCGATPEYTTYYAGPTFEGLAMTDAERLCEQPDPILGRNSYVSYVYGTCEPPAASSELGDPGGCTAPLEVQSAPLCERHANLYTDGIETSVPYPYSALSVRGVPGASFDGGTIVEIYTDATTVAIFGDDPAQVLRLADAVTQAPAAAIPAIDQVLTSVPAPQMAPANPLPAPQPGLVESTVECYSQP